MQDEIKIPEVKTDIPEYPNWDNGIKWGLILSLPVFIFCLSSPTSEIPPPPWYVLISRNMPLALLFSLMAFLPVCSIVACKPIRGGKDSKDRQSQGINNKLLYLIGFIIACILLGILIQKIKLMAMERDISPDGGPDPFFTTFLLTAPILLGSCLAFPLGLFALAIKITRPIGVFILCGAMAFLLTLRIYDHNSIRMEAFQKAGKRLTPLINAIEQYKADKGEYPAKLDVLIPEYLTELPSTGMKNYSKYEYELGERAGFRGENPWTIVVDAGYGMGFDKFVYYPLQKEWLYLKD